MKASYFAKFLEGKVDASSIKREISEPVADMRLLMKKLGYSTPIVITGDIDKFTVTKSHVKLICETYLTEALDDIEVEYLTSALELCWSFKFESEQVEDAVAGLSCSVSNGPLTSEIAQEIIESLDS